MLERFAALVRAARLVPRRFDVFLTALVVYVTLRTTRARLRFTRAAGDAKHTAWGRAHRAAARRMLAMARRRRGLWLKCGQYVAGRTDALPDEYAEVLSGCMDKCPETPPAVVRAVVEGELGCRIEDVFQGFQVNAIASASIAQVHRARLLDGTDVVLKVQHPGVRELLLQDLEDLRTIVRLVAGAEPAFDMGPILDSWLDMVPMETSFLNEMHNMIRIRDSLASPPPGLPCNAYVPEPISHLTTDRLLVMEYIDGWKITDVQALRENGADLEKLVTEITKSFGQCVFVSSIFSGDLHAGNLLVRRDNSPALIDFGICVELAPEMQHGFARLVLAAVDNDSYSLLQSFADIGIELNRADPVASMDAIKYLFRTTVPREESRKEQEAFRLRMQMRADEMKERGSGVAVSGEKLGGDARHKRAVVDAYPGDLVFLFRSLALLRGLAVTLGVRHTYLATLRHYAEYCLRESCPASERMTSVVARQGSEACPEARCSQRARTARDALAAVFDELYERGMMIGMQVAAYKNGELVVDMAAGRMGRYNSRPVRTSTIFNSFSTTKGVCAILFAGIQDEYGVEYDERLGDKLWPQFAAAGKEDATVAHVLSHRTGLAAAAPPDMSMIRLRDDWRGVISHLESSPPAHPPGSKFEYHALNFGWLVAGLIEKISGSSLQNRLARLAATLGVESECYCGNLPDSLRTDSATSQVASLSSSIFADLQKHAAGRSSTSDNSSLGANISVVANANPVRSANLRADAKNNVDELYSEVKAGKILSDRLTQALRSVGFLSSELEEAPAYLLDPTFFNHPVLRAAFVPSANGHFSARALAKIYAVLANDGIIDGHSILRPGRVSRMQTPLCKSPGSWPSWGAGLCLYDLIDKAGNTLEAAGMGHGGIGGSMALAVPSHGFSIAVTLNHLSAASAAAAAIMLTAFRAFDVPVPASYHAMEQRAFSAWRRHHPTAESSGALEGQSLVSLLDNLDDLDAVQVFTG